jgi:hypothetical protein
VAGNHRLFYFYPHAPRLDRVHFQFQFPSLSFFTATTSDAFWCPHGQTKGGSFRACGGFGRCRLSIRAETSALVGLAWVHRDAFHLVASTPCRSWCVSGASIARRLLLRVRLRELHAVHHVVIYLLFSFTSSDGELMNERPVFVCVWTYS